MRKWQVYSLVVVVAASALATVLMHRQLSVEAKAESWVRGRGYGHAILLRADGTYLARTVCDVCDKKNVVEGTWFKSGRKINLVRARETVVLEEVKYGGCRGMLVVGIARAEKVALKDVYFREGDPCAAQL
jgi:hypothetical protein